MPVFRALARYFQSLAGRLALLLTFGIALASVGSLALAEHAQTIELQRYRAQRIAMSAQDLAERLRRAPEETEMQLRRHLILGAHWIEDGRKLDGQPDRYVQSALNEKLEKFATAQKVDFPRCIGKFTLDRSKIPAGFIPNLPECWVIRYDLGAAGHVRISLDVPAIDPTPSTSLNPRYLLSVLGASAVLSVLVSRLAMGSLRRLTQAARTFASSIDAPAICEDGPSDVREAFATFNLMQDRVREGVRERTRMLAAISHDLQTPMTRLRLRLEGIPDQALREPMIADLAAMLRLVREGLTLARSSEAEEVLSPVDIDSFLASIADDAVYTGADVVVIGRCESKVLVKPDALTRCLQNLLDNAVRYGGATTLSASNVGNNVMIDICDAGPGISAELIEQMFEPFVRGEASRSRETGGTGIGLTIARAQAKTFGAIVTLSNRKTGGLVARLEIPRCECV